MDNQSSDNEIDFIKIYSIIRDKKIFVLSCTSIFSLISVLYALSLPNIYTSKALLMPTSSEDSLSSKLGSFSSLAEFSGISVGSEKASKSEEAIARIKSLNFFTTYFVPNIKLENLLAEKAWNPSSNSIIYDNDIYDFEKKEWTIESNYQNNSTPSIQMAYKEYLKILDISESNKNSFVSISIKHLSPYIAKDWLNIIIFNINESMREEDKKNANKAITFLSEASSSTNIKTILDKNSLLLENQIQNLMLASSNESYIFKSLDPPFIPEKKSSPARAIICITGFFIGLFCSLVFIFHQYYRNLFVNNDA